MTESGNAGQDLASSRRAGGHRSAPRIEPTTRVVRKCVICCDRCAGMERGEGRQCAFFFRSEIILKISCRPLTFTCSGSYIFRPSSLNAARPATPRFLPPRPFSVESSCRLFLWPEADLGQKLDEHAQPSERRHRPRRRARIMPYAGRRRCCTRAYSRTWPS